ncbi:MAG: MotA/TolQ/ExbB proton channel family protein [Methylotenera sp.]|nr:MotA/TolQ/ExbB proton channel family protein [Methylotenera sp.]
MPTPTTAPALGFAHFLSHADGVAITILIIMAVMSMVSWTIIAIKSIRHYLERRRSAHFMRYFWEAPSLVAIQAHVKVDGINDPFSHMTAHGFRAIEQFSKKDGSRMVESGSADEFLTRSLRRAYEQETARREGGLTFLASVGSSAPFIGLFGTVWGIYHALLAIGTSGQGTLDKVAGPVGEALIMTALGLAVAIPAVLAYNTFTRQNRVILAQLDGFAHDLFAFTSTGNRASASDLRLVNNSQPAGVKTGV